MATPNRTVGSSVPLSGQSSTPRTGASATVHHLATQAGSLRTTATPFANLQQGIIAMQSSMQRGSSGSGGTVRPSTVNTSVTKLATNTAASPRKKIKLEEVLPASDEIAAKRKLILDERASQMLEIKENYMDHLTECFFLQNGGQLMDYYPWRRRPTPQLVDFLKTGKMDSDDEDENPLIYLKERKPTDEVKVLGNAGAGASTTTPVATSTTLPASVAALSQQGPDSSRVPGGRHGMVFGHSQHLAQSLTLPTVMTVHVTQSTSGVLPSGRTVSLATTTVTTASAMSQHVAGHLHKSASDSRLLHTTSSTQSTKTVMTSQSSMLNLKKSPPASPGRHRQNSDGTNIKGISSQEAIVERAKQEAQVMSRVAELRKEGLWSSRRLPKVQEAARTKAHWDYLLEEMQWLAADFLQERKWKKTCARKIAKMVQKHFQELEQRELRAEREESMKLKRIAAQLGKMVKEFWGNIEKVVQYKQTSRLDEKRKKAMDVHLNFIVDQTEKYSSWLSEGLAQSSKGSSAGSQNTTPDNSVAGDDEFRPDDSESDDEETIAKDEEGIDEDETKDEIEALQKESEIPIEQILESLPKEIIEKPASLHSDSEEETNKKDGEFDVGAEEDAPDVEETIEEQEKVENSADVKQEIDDLRAEGEMDIDELRAKYANAYDNDFDDFHIDSDEESTDINETEDEESEEEEEDEEEVDVEGGEEVGLEALVEADAAKHPDKKVEDGPSQELTDIAAQALSLQPKGYTLQTTEVKTGVPFLLKHTLREYQHVGLDWLATMYEKRLNGILADEMGLGKTIQTIALLAHLACEKGIWGPHLIVVPTSVMLNWEMELKKWCPGFKILTYYGSQKERKQKRTAQNIKNFKSQRWQCLLNFNSMRRLLLTGTPLQNSLMELWSLMHFLMPNVFQSHKDFKEWFANPLTGMIEGSHEYNESLIRRLHKVLRPFLLRRLKDDVEKQMPKKYEHIVMCHLSKRQRFLYDEFMAQGKTKETLATGHFMSVINILMQLRKVCNHPSLFDPRPIVSPLQLEGIVYNTASLVLKVFDYHPLEKLDLHRYPGLAEMERDLPAFIAHRVRNLQAPRRLIEEIDIEPAPPARPPHGKLKTAGLRCVSPAIQSGRASPAVLSRSVSPSPGMKPASSSTPAPSTTVPQPPLQATVAPQAGAQGFIQIVQTSSGQHVIAASNQASSVATTATIVNGSSVTTLASSTVKLVSSQSGQVRLSVGQPAVQLPASSFAPGQPRPVMRVSPLVDGHKHNNGSVFTEAASSSATSSVTSSSSKPLPSARPSQQICKYWEERKKKLKKSPFYLEPLCEQQRAQRREKLCHIAKVNQQHCEVKPVYGQDLCEAINIFKDPYSGKCYRNRDTDTWNGPGHIHCHCAKFCSNPHHPKYLWNQTKVLSDITHSPEQYLKELEDVLQRFVFVTPPVQSPPLRMHASHPPGSFLQQEAYRDHLIRHKLSPKTRDYHSISTKMTVQFPELRLIQYDCGKLQTLDILLRRLKSGDHRVLIFTQMTRMLDILEAFLNYHGHIYVRLDGTTRVEQRQILMDRFNADRRIFVFILSTRSGGIGVNLTGADTVIFYDSDWNPTMDAQAQDRCHRIGQTRDVHIYRLVSERTVEENILKKANQKRMLGDMAIEGGNFTTAFFKQDTIGELFQEPSGLECLVKEKQAEEQHKQELKQDTPKLEPKTQPAPPPAPTTRPTRKAGKKTEEVTALTQFEKALAKTEDESDVIAIEQVKAEQKAELAEFDENIPWDEKEAEQRGDEESHVEMELANLDKELSPIERFAVLFMEQQMEPVNQEELMIAEEDIENVKKDWELNRLKALKEEEERKAELEEDEMLYTYSRDDAYHQVKKRNMQLAHKARKAAAEAKAAALSPSRKRAELGESEEEKKKAWVYKTPKLIRQILRGSSEVCVESEGGEGKDAGKAGRRKVRVEEDTEEVDVETLAGLDHLPVTKATLKHKLKNKVDKPDKTDKPKRQRKPKGEGKIVGKTVLVKDKTVLIKQVKDKTVLLKDKSKSLAASLAACTVEATRLESLPGFSNSVSIGALQNQITPTKVSKESLFEKLQSPAKSVQDRANIFEQFSAQAPTVQAMNVAQPQLLEGTLAGGTVRLVNTPQGRQIVVVSSSPPAIQQSPQNVVYVQGMSGFQGLVVGNSVVSLQASPINMAQFARTSNPINLQTSGLVGTPQVVQPRLGARIVTPVQVTQVQQNPTFVQRLVPGSPVANIASISGLGVPQLTSIPVPTGLASIQQLSSASGAPVVQVGGGQTVNISSSQLQQVQQIAPVKPAPAQPPASQRKSHGQTIADLIAAGQASKGSLPATLPATFPNLGNIMKAQVPPAGIPTAATAQSGAQVKVNPAVAKLVASHIQAGQLSSAQSVATTVSTQKAQGSAIINLGSTSRSQSPTIVKLVSTASLRPGSPVTVMGSKGQVVKAQVAGQSLQRGEAPVATINIKGLPPGVSIPASLVNSLVSGSIGGISKAGLNVIRGSTPVPGQVVAKGIKTASASTLNSPRETGQVKQITVAANGSSPSVNHRQAAAKLPKPAIQLAKPQCGNPSTSQIVSKSTTPVGSPALSPKVGSPATPQAWSNPNLVIRTRRAVKEGKSPQIIPHRKEPSAVQLPTPVLSNVLTNNVSMINVQKLTTVDVADQIPVTVKVLEQSTANAPDPQSNGTVDASVEIK